LWHWVLHILVTCFLSIFNSQNLDVHHFYADSDLFRFGFHF
jgi:hypothetical protein